jgi:hypothetical protein
VNELFDTRTVDPFGPLTILEKTKILFLFLASRLELVSSLRDLEVLRKREALNNLRIDDSKEI